MPWSRAASAASPSVGHVAGQRHRLVHRQRLGQRLGRLRRAHAFDRVAGHRCSPHQRYRPRQADSTIAMLRGARPRACSCATQRRTWCGCTSRSSTPAALAATLQAPQRVAVHRQRARRQAALDAQVPQVALQLVGQRRGGALTARAQQARQPGAGDLADARQELGAHVGAVARRVGRAEHQQAEGVVAAGRAQRHQRHRRHAGRIVEPARGLEAGVHAAVGRARLAAKLRVRRSRPARTASAVNGVGHAPEAERGLRDQELLLQLAHQHLGQFGARRR